jgi:hypothetical protein
MHDRYFYLADVFSVIYALYRPRTWYVAALIVGASLLAYIAYVAYDLSYFEAFVVDLRIASLLNAIALFLLLFLARQRLVATLSNSPEGLGAASISLHRNDSALRARQPQGTRQMACDRTAPGRF